MIISPSLQAHALLIHSAFETLALLVGAYLYRRALENRQSNLLEPQRLAVALGCLFGAGTGNKAMFWIERPDCLPNTCIVLLIFSSPGRA